MICEELQTHFVFHNTLFVKSIAHKKINKNSTTLGALVLWCSPSTKRSFINTVVSPELNVLSSTPLVSPDIQNDKHDPTY
jgi:hypothetical protein